MSFEIITIDDKTCVRKRGVLTSNEALVLSQLDHPRIPKLISSDVEEIVIEYIEGVDMFDHIESLDFKVMSEDDVSKLMLQLIDICVYLHSKAIAHMDIKLDNTIIRDSQVYLIDFGLSMDTKVEIPTRHSGSVLYTAPEILMGMTHYDPFATDVFSLGVVWYCLLTMLYPFSENRIYYLSRYPDPAITYPENVTVSQEIRSLIARMTNHNPSRRPKMTEIRDSLFE